MRLRGLGPVLALSVAGGAIRFATLGQQSFWLDEAVTGRLMRLGLAPMLRAIPRSESTPPLYYVLAWLWTRVFGVSEVGLRSLSAALGTATIPLVYGAAARMFDRRAAVGAAALASFAPLLVWYSQEARSYALLVALCAAGLWAFAAALDPRPGRRGALWVWATASGLALVTHYFAVFMVGPELCWLLWRRRRAVLPAAVLVVLVGLAIAPLAIHQRANGSAGFITETPLVTRIPQAAKQLAFGYDAPADRWIVVSGCLLGVVAICSAWRALEPARRFVVCAVAGLGLSVVVLPAVLALVGEDYLITRNVIVAWVPAAVALAGVLAVGRATGAAVLVGLCGLGLAVTVGVDLNPRYQRDDWRAAARTVPAQLPSVIEASPANGRVALQYYLPRARQVPPSGARVAAVEVVSLGVRAIGEPVKAPALPASLPLLAGFLRPVALVRPTFTVLSYRAIHGAALVTPSMLFGLASNASDATQLLTARR